MPSTEKYHAHDLLNLLGSLPVRQMSQVFVIGRPKELLCVV